MEELLSLFMIMQIIKSITIYSINLPANILIYIRELRSLVDFEMIHPSKLLQFIYTPEVSHKVLDRNLENSGIKDGSFLNNMGGYIFLLGAFLIFMVIMLIALVVCRKHKEKIKAKLLKIK